ncbi:MAG TPA: TetR/AcrR family transcriptional regulator [Vicinamibacterales bacterium]|jgi:AcrR family transcriptional regulator|nr:TetR/AcrR family transcriptional regulator [Vicinamibacterales bacterium]
MMSSRAEAGAATRERIIATARKLFTERGFEGTSTESVLEESSVSRGALYHHFENKRALFAAVLDAVEADIARQTRKAGAAFGDPVDALCAGFDVFLGLASSNPEVRQVVLIDAHSAVGWETWREIDERHGFGRIKDALKKAAALGYLAEGMVDTYSHMLLASVIEVAFLIARTPPAETTLEKGRTAMREMVNRLLTPGRAGKD